MVTLTLLHPQASTPMQQWEFHNRSNIKIGRSPDNDVVIDNPLVSRFHLELHKVGDLRIEGVSEQWQLVNHGTNGTLLNGIVVTRGFVNNDSLIQLARGGPTLKFKLQQVVATPHPPPPSVACNHAGNPPGSLFCIHCGQPLVQVQQYVRNYQVLRILGQGGMGTTYLALDKHSPQTGKPQMLVLKEMNADMAQIAKARELFEREARILKELHHQGIPTYYDFFIEGNKKYLAMQLVHGQDLEKRIYQQGPVIPTQAIEWMIQTCDILEYIHSQNPPLIHRDIKPANLMVRQLDNRVVVLDFGAVKEIDARPGTRIGAEGYSAPEQDRGQPCTQSDLYAIGPTLIFALTGENPMNFYRKRGAEYRFDIQSIPTITPKLAAVIDRVTEHKPRDRFQTAKQLSQALQSAISF
ncbi:serine/threonine protein kinase with FHA domain [Crinalium epipsammum PCC 9333]|uniref:Serine/threonine protein kinase with FHA domain n=1 Tax=Crinalium epipsammum PCC 9333 TaxID=1173022 RepID=K9W318_9CYAN|nr:protein kinase [Crinalium epipsammum]AFZ13830.1 serine/threonine protein kinase with FHA domain [Crinalium epipsammum PCC 9333]